MSLPRRSFLALVGLASAGVVQADTIKMKSDDGGVRHSGGITSEDMARAYERIAQMIREGTLLCETIEIRNGVRPGDLIRQIVTSEFIIIDNRGET